MSEIYNNLNHTIYLNIINIDDIPNIHNFDPENRIHYEFSKNTITICPETSITLNEKKSMVYIFAYDSTKKIYRSDRFLIDFPSTKRIMIGEKVYKEIKFANEYEFDNFNPDMVLGLSYLIPDYIIYFYNVIYIFLLFIIIIIAAIILILFTK